LNRVNNKLGLVYIAFSGMKIARSVASILAATTTVLVGVDVGCRLGWTLVFFWSITKNFERFATHRSEHGIPESKSKCLMRLFAGMKAVRSKILHIIAAILLRERHLIEKNTSVQRSRHPTSTPTRTAVVVAGFEATCRAIFGPHKSI